MSYTTNKCYNANGWLTNISDGGTKTIVSYEYDAAGQRKKATLGNTNSTEYVYDDAGQVTDIWHRKSDGSTISRYQYGYDDAGQRTWVKRATGKGDVFKYDAIDQLTNVLYEATNPDTTPVGWSNQVKYFFDAAGNRTNVTDNGGTIVYIPNPLNEYTNVNGIKHSYDVNGNFTNSGSGGTGWIYGYDRENRFRTAKYCFPRIPDPLREIYFTYDVFGRLTEERVKWGASLYYTNRYVYDNEWRMLAWYYSDSTGYSALLKYVYGSGVDEPVMLKNSGTGTNYYYHAAALGTVTELTDTNGMLVEQYTYDVYGTPTYKDGVGNSLSGSMVGNVLLFQGRVIDRYLGLYNYRKRYYSPGLGRFVQVDPIPLEIWSSRDANGEDSIVNLYGFVLNDPIGKVDLNGAAPSSDAKSKPKPPPKKPPKKPPVNPWRCGPNCKQWLEDKSEDMCSACCWEQFVLDEAKNPRAGIQNIARRNKCVSTCALTDGASGPR